MPLPEPPSEVTKEEAPAPQAIPETEELLKDFADFIWQNGYHHSSEISDYPWQFKSNKQFFKSKHLAKRFLAALQGSDSPQAIPKKELITEFKKLKHGVYKLYWKSGGSSLVSVGMTHDGTNWYAPCNWASDCVSPGMPKTPQVASTDWSSVSALVLIQENNYDKASLIGKEEGELQPCCANSCDGFKCESGSVHLITSPVEQILEYMFQNRYNETNPVLYAHVASFIKGDDVASDNNSNQSK
jgi:hypothetical protein